MATQILLADDHLIVRQGLRVLLDRERLQVVGEASNGHEAIRLARMLDPEVAVLDLAMPLLNGIDAAREILRNIPKPKVILLTMHTEDHYVIEAIRAGVRGYVLKIQAATDLIQAIDEVSQGRTYLSPRISRTLVDAYLARTEVPPDPLTSKERQVLQLIAEGKTTKQTAALLGVSARTADSHRTNIMQKLDIHETASLVRYAIRRGIVQI
jgi:two-component system, NarL family, response regulator NreC